jgi:hypothetical protein
MPESLKILGQLLPANTTLTNCYTVPAGSSATISSVSVCNLTNAVKTFRISVAIAGAADTNKQYIFYDQEIEAFSNFTATIGITMAATDVLRVQTSNANALSFNVFGIEVS